MDFPLHSNAALKSLVNVPKHRLSLFRFFDKLSQEALRMLVVVLAQIVLKSCFGVFDALQIGIPVINIRKAAQKDPALMPVEGADALHLIQKENLVELDEPIFQPQLDRLKTLLSDHNITLA